MGTTLRTDTATVTKQVEAVIQVQETVVARTRRVVIDAAYGQVPAIQIQREVLGISSEGARPASAKPTLVRATGTDGTEPGHWTAAGGAVVGPIELTGADLTADGRVLVVDGLSVPMHLLPVLLAKACDLIAGDKVAGVQAAAVNEAVQRASQRVAAEQELADWRARAALGDLEATPARVGLAEGRLAYLSQ